MSYTKQNFEDGQVLTAEHLNNMEDGIKAVSEEIANYSWNDLKDKPFGETEKTVILEEQELVVDAEEGSAIAEIATPITEGDLLVVKYDGVAYECDVFDIDGNIAFGDIAILGADYGGGEPFAGIYADGMVLIVPADVETTSIVCEISLVSFEKLPNKYIKIRTIFYMGNDKYLYVDKGCTQKVTRTELLNAAKNGWVVGMTFADDGTFDCAISPNGVVNMGSYALFYFVNMEAKASIYYTAEYTG